MRLLTVFGLFVALSQYSTAQRAAHAITPHSATPHLNSATGSFAFGRTFGSRFRQPFPDTSLLFPFFADSFNPDDLYSTGYPVVLKLPESCCKPRVPSPVRLKPVPRNMRIDSLCRTAADDRTRKRPLRPREQRCGGWRSLPLNLAPDRTPSPPSELAPVLLVFRDGHSEEVRNYIIADGILHASGDYYTDGYWNKKIALSTINLQQTLEANAKRNVNSASPNPRTRLPPAPDSSTREPHVPSVFKILNTRIKLTFLDCHGHHHAGKCYSIIRFLPSTPANATI